jgi:hypothetical protein
MQEKQKVTLYLPPDLHRQLKIRSAIDDEPMSSLAERALGFYLSHPDLVESCESHGRTHQVHNCPECHTAVVLRENVLTAVGQSPILSEDLVLQQVRDSIGDSQLGEDQDEEVLVPC